MSTPVRNRLRALSIAALLAVTTIPAGADPEHVRLTAMTGTWDVAEYCINALLLANASMVALVQGYSPPPETAPAIDEAAADFKRLLGSRRGGR
jgi:hypothetical protein